MDWMLFFIGIVIGFILGWLVFDVLWRRHGLTAGATATPDSAELMELRRQVAAAEATEGDLLARLEALEAQGLSGEVPNGEIDGLRSALAEHEAAEAGRREEMMALRRDLGERDSGLSRLRAELDTERQSRRELEERLRSGVGGGDGGEGGADGAAVAELERLRAAEGRCQSDLAALRQELAARDDGISGLRAELDGERRQREALEADLAARIAAGQSSPDAAGSGTGAAAAPVMAAGFVAAPGDSGEESDGDDDGGEDGGDDSGLQALFERPSGEPDDLTQIKGIGQVIVKKLHRLGITQFAQIANFTPDDIARVDEVLAFKGRIEREKWVEQARDFVAQG